MRSPRSRAALALAGVAIGGLLAWFTFRSTPLAAVGQVLRDGRWGGAVFVVLVATSAFGIAKTIRWRVLLGRPHELGFGALLRPVLAGLALNTLVPHSGEVFRAVALQRTHARSPAQVLASIFVERLFDLFAILLLAAGALMALPRAIDSLGPAFEAVGAIAALGAAAVIVALAWPERVRATLGLFARPLPARWRERVARLADELILGLAPVRSPAILLQALAWSLVQWFATVVSVLGSAWIAGFALGVPAGILVSVGIVVAFLLPNAPGYVGATQLAFVVALHPLGVPDARALAASLVYQLLQILPLLLAGLVVLKSAWGRRSSGAGLNAP